MYLDNKNTPFIIAEAGINHNGSLTNALKMIDSAVAAGADCIKFQAFTTKDLVTKGSKLVDSLSSCELKLEDFFTIKSYCDEKEIIFLATPFSSYWVYILIGMGVSCCKIGSGNLNELDLLRVIGQSKLPVLLSTGMFHLREIKKAIDILVKEGTNDISLLHCTSLYPTAIEKVNLFSIGKLKEEFGFPVGFSDHTTDVRMGGLSVAAGSVILEKHFTLNKMLEGPDHKMSLEPWELKNYIDYARQVKVICGENKKEPLDEELLIRKEVTFSIVAKEFISKGTIIERNMLSFKRPGRGISPIDVSRVVDSFAKKDIQVDELITSEHFYS